MTPDRYRKLQDKHVLIIGGTSGIGLAVAEASLASGANVTISSSSQQRVDTAVSQLSTTFPDRTVRGVVADLSRPTVDEDLDTLFTAAQTGQGIISHVVFTAADALSLGGLDQVTVEGVHRAAHMRMVVPVLVGKTAARYLPRTNQSSMVITSGSVAERPTKGWAVTSYFAGGLVSLAKALAVDLAPVRVNVVRPGYVDTGLWGHMSARDKEEWVEGVEEKMLTGKFAGVEDVAEAYLWLMKDGNATGTVAGTDSGALLV